MAYFGFTKTVLTWLFKKPATLMYPVVPRKFYEATRGNIEIEIEKCIYCGMCSRKCPTAALTVNRNEKEWIIQRTSCITCGYCVDVCPKKCLKMGNTYSTSVVQKDKEVHKGA